MQQILVNDRWPLWLLEHRAARPEWPWWEAHRLALVHHLISDIHRPVVYEIGAEEGDYPALYARWGARVVLIEPNPFVWPQIREHWQANTKDDPAGWYVGFASNITQVAVTDYDDSDRDGWPACAYGPIMPEHGFRHIREHAGNTNQKPIDQLQADLGWLPPSLITIDVEGGEWHVLQGAEQTLREQRPHVIASIHPDFLRDLYGTEPQTVHDWMSELGYQPRRICIDHEEHWWYQP